MLSCPKSPPTFLVFISVRAFVSSLSSNHCETIHTKTEAEKGQVPCSRSQRSHSCLGEENFSFTPLGSFDWSNNEIDIRERNRRETNLILYIRRSHRYRT